MKTQQNYTNSRLQRKPSRVGEEEATQQHEIVILCVSCESIQRRLSISNTSLEVHATRRWPSRTQVEPTGLYCGFADNGRF